MADNRRVIRLATARSRAGGGRRRQAAGAQGILPKISDPGRVYPIQDERGVAAAAAALPKVPAGAAVRLAGITAPGPAALL